MGRVYNALAKADRLTDGQRPIGRPASADTTPKPPGAATRRSDNAAMNVVPAARADAIPAPAFDFVIDEPVASSEPADIAQSSDFDHLFALSEATGARRAVEPVLPPTAADFLTPRAYPVAAPSNRPVAPSPFEEPRQVVNVKGLKIAPHVAAIAGGDALAAERYRTLAVRLSASAARRKIKSVVVTSADAGEGKSTVAASLAWTLARPGSRRVLLLEANVRAASICQLLDVKPARGWLGLSDAPASFAGARRV